MLRDFCCIFEVDIAVLQLDLILKTAYQVGKPVDPKPGVKNQEDFSKMLIMECPLIGIGIAKLTVGVRKIRT